MLTHTHEERQPGTTSPVRFENLRCATAALPCCWLTRRDELLHVRDCWGNCQVPQQSHNSSPPPIRPRGCRGSGGGGGIKGVEMTAGCFSHSAGETVQTGRYCCNNKGGQLQLSLFSLPALAQWSRSHAVHVHVETKECRVGGFTCYVHTAINSDLNMVCCLKFY